MLQYYGGQALGACPECQKVCPMKHASFLLILLCCGLWGCARLPIAPAPTTPVDDVHQQWVQGLRESNFDQVYGAMVPIDSKEMLTDLMLEHAREWQQAGAVAGTSGALVAVEVLPVQVDAGNGKGVSVWQYEQGAWCLITHLRPTDNGWRVLNFGTDPSCEVLDGMQEKA